MIKKITLEINKKTIELTPEDAKKLYFQLDQLFGQKQTIQPNYPVLEPKWPQWPQSPIVTCDGTNNTEMSTNNGEMELSAHNEVPT